MEPRVTLNVALAFACSLLASWPLGAQSPTSATTLPLPNGTSGGTVLPSRPIAGRLLGDIHLRGLPSAGTVWGLIDGVDAFTIVDRIEGGGLYLGEPALLGSHGASWTQATYVVDGLDVTDPERTGTPLFVPDPSVFGAVALGHSFLGVEVGGAGTVAEFVPRAPAGVWGGSLRFSYAPHQLQKDRVESAIPPVARLVSAGQGDLLLSGPLSGRFGVLVSGRAGASRRLERGDPLALDSRLGSLFAHATIGLSPRDRLRVIGGGDAVRHPFAARARFPGRDADGRDDYRRLQATWEHVGPGGTAWSLSAGYQRANLAAPVTGGETVTGVIERLLDGPVADLVSSPWGPRGRWGAAFQIQPAAVDAGGRHVVRAGLTASRAFSSVDPQPRALVGELVDGLPARIWDYRSGPSVSSRGATELAAWADDLIQVLPRVSLDLGARFEWTEASATGHDQIIRWRTVLPRALLRWQMSDRGQATAFVGYGYSRHRLPLSYLAYGDPNAPAGQVYRWTDPNGDGLVQASEAGTLIATVGPGERSFFGSRIDPALRPPVAKEFVVGFEARFGGHWLFRTTGVERRDNGLVAPVNEGVTLADYDAIDVFDRGNDFLNPIDDRHLTVYSRKPSSFGRDRDVLTNPPGHDSHYIGVDVTVERAFDGRWHMLLGAAALRSDGTAGNRGFHANENDVAVLGEAFRDPNALTYTRGRLFFERGYVIKWSGGVATGHGLHLAAVARYQDGQHFARKVIVPTLAQGPDAIQAYTRGHSRFTFTFTLDGRIEQTLPVAGGRLGLVFDAFNVLNTGNEVEEDPVTTRVFRASTVLQPPRVLRLGLRFDF